MLNFFSLTDVFTGTTNEAESRVCFRVAVRPALEIPPSEIGISALPLIGSQLP